ncbi:hypothetical protein BJ912DRAFT_155936 [Pholiota molesta]|nr:hypothetical protein BJ912DRAFT_155936 [Pholiota molesta]
MLKRTMTLIPMTITLQFIQGMTGQTRKSRTVRMAFLMIMRPSTLIFPMSLSAMPPGNLNELTLIRRLFLGPFSGTMGYTQNQDESLTSRWGIPSTLVCFCKIPNCWMGTESTTHGNFESSEDIGFRRDFNNVPEHSPTKRKRSDSLETAPSGTQSSVKTESPTRHSQRREVVGSVATRLAGEKRRKSEATFVCNQCGHSFTRNHNRLNHIRTHDGEAGTQCPRTGCGKPLAKTSLSRHLKNCRGS